jgi:cell wall-associated NlpC family hydrolase
VTWQAIRAAITARVAAASAACLVASLVAGLAGAPSAVADPGLTTARAKAKALRTQVTRLEVQAEQAIEDYDALQAQLAAAVTKHVSATRELDRATTTRHTRQVEATQRVRALYMSGGSAALYASVLDGRDIGDVLTRAATVRNLMLVDRAEVGSADGMVARATALATRLEQLAAERTGLEERAGRAADRVRTLLARTQQLLADADARVLRLAEEERRRQAAAAAAAAAARLSQLGLLDATTAPGTQWALAAMSAARTKLGVPYTWGATGPDTFDCSGLTGWAYRQAGLSLPRTSREQWYAGFHPPLNQLAPGDLLFWATDLSDPRTIHHVALYIGKGQMIHAPRTGDVVRVALVNTDGLIGAVRPGTTGSALP